MKAVAAKLIVGQRYLYPCDISSGIFSTNRIINFRAFGNYGPEYTLGDGQVSVETDRANLFFVVDDLLVTGGAVPKKGFGFIEGTFFGFDRDEARFVVSDNLSRSGKLFMVNAGLLMKLDKE